MKKQSNSLSRRNPLSPVFLAVCSLLVSFVALLGLYGLRQTTQAVGYEENLSKAYGNHALERFVDCHHSRMF